MAPTRRRLVAEALGVAYSGQRHAGDEQEDGGQAIESGGQAEQAVGGAEQVLAQQHRQCREDAAASDGVGWRGELRLGLVDQAGAGERAAFDGAGRAAHGRLLVAGVAGIVGGAIAGRSRVGLRSAGVSGVIGGRSRRRSVRDGGECPAGAAMTPARRFSLKVLAGNAELPCAGAAAHPGGEQVGPLVRQLGVDDGAPAPP